MFGSELTMLIILGKHYKTLEADENLPLLVGQVCVRISAFYTLCISPSWIA